jgi:hypothetical protein
MGIIPKQSTNTTVGYFAYFRDNLNYTSREKSGYYVKDHKLQDVYATESSPGSQKNINF